MAAWAVLTFATASDLMLGGPSSREAHLWAGRVPLQSKPLTRTCWRSAGSSSSLLGPATAIHSWFRHRHPEGLNHGPCPLARWSLSSRGVECRRHHVRTVGRCPRCGLPGKTRVSWNPVPHHRAESRHLGRPRTLRPDLFGFMQRLNSGARWNRMVVIALESGMLLAATYV